MNQKHQEQISDLLDNVLISPDALDELLWAMNKSNKNNENNENNDLRNQWQRYQLIGTVLRQESIHPENLQLADRVRKHIQQLPPLPLQPKKAARSWIPHKMRFTGGWALAASVVLLAFVIESRLLPLTSTSKQIANHQPPDPLPYTQRRPRQQASALTPSLGQTLAHDQLPASATANPYVVAEILPWPRMMQNGKNAPTRQRIVLHGTARFASNPSPWRLLNRSTGLAAPNQCWLGTAGTPIRRFLVRDGAATVSVFLESR